MPDAFSATNPKYTIAATPRRYKAKIYDGVLSFRHPWVICRDNRGKLLNGCFKLLLVKEQEVVEKEANKLVSVAPRVRSEAPQVVRIELLDEYFQALPPD